MTIALGMLTLSGCTLSDEDAARQARNPDVVSSTAEGTQATAPSDTDVTASTMMKPVAGLGAPIALLINNAGVPGLGNTSMANVRVTPEQQACLEREASALERADLRTLTTNGGFVDLTVSGTVIVTKAINACLPPKVLAERLGEEYAMRLRVDKRTDPKFAACITEQIRGESGRLVMEVARVAGRGGQKLPQAVKAVVDPCGNTHLQRMLIDHYVRGGYSSTTASCMAFGFMPRITISDVLDEGGITNFEKQLSPTLALDLKDVTLECDPKKVGRQPG